MPIWKQRLFSRLMNPADGEGNDLGGGTDTQTVDDATQDDSTDEPSATEEAAQALTQDDTNAELPTDKPQSSKMLALLDEISGDKPAAPAGEEKPNKEVKPEDEPKPAANADEAKTVEQEEAELLDGVKSERGKDRIRQVFAEKKQLEQDMTEFKQLVQGTGMTPQDFAQTLEFGRLVNSGDEKDVRVALEMLESQRAMLYQRLGVEAPGVDLLKDHDDLKQAVDNMEITRERAVELAKFRKSEAAKAQQQQEVQATTQRQQEFQQTVQSAAGAMEAYPKTRASEVDHPARMKVITAHFQNPANLQAFIQTYQPNQWAATIKMMYDGIVVPQAPAGHQPQPMRSRPTQLGTPAAQGATPIDRLAQRLDNMGI